MKKKKVLFTIGVLGSGGISKSMVNLLNAMDRSLYEVHLLIMSSTVGPYEIFVPEDVIKHRIPEIGWISSGVGGLKELLFHGHFLLFLGSLLRLFFSTFDKATAARLLAWMYPKLEDEFDTIVEYNGQQNLYYMVDKLEAKHKITFFHSDYAKYSYYYKADKKYYPKVDKIYTISPTCVDSLKKYFPELSDRIGLFENISLPSMIYKLAEQERILPEYDGAVLVTIGLISYNKGFDLIVDTAKMLRAQSVDFKWIMVGEPIEDANPYLERMKREGLAEYFVFAGVQTNPYSYMKRATIIVHASRYEGKSIALDEAKILCKPIVVTNFSTVNDQFEDEINASICEMKSDSLSLKIIDLLNNKKKQVEYARSLEKEVNQRADTKESISRLLDLQ